LFFSRIAVLSKSNIHCRLAAALAEAAELAKNASPPKKTRGSLEERLREMRKENSEGSSVRVSRWQDDYKQTKLREKIAQVKTD